MKIYVPQDSTYNKCYVIQSEGVIRGYSQVPAYNTSINYRDYYIDSSYIYRDNTATFGNYSSLPVCLASNDLTNNVFYRNDIDKILVIFIILLIIGFYFPYKIISRMFGRWLKL